MYLRVCTGSALTTAVAARVPPAAAISPLVGPPELEDAVDAQREKVRLVGCLWPLDELVFIFFRTSAFVACAKCCSLFDCLNEKVSPCCHAWPSSSLTLCKALADFVQGISAARSVLSPVTVCANADQLILACCSCGGSFVVTCRFSQSLKQCMLCQHHHECVLLQVGTRSCCICGTGRANTLSRRHDFALLGQLQTVFSPKAMLRWQIPLRVSDRELFYAQAKKAYKHMKARKDMNLASRQHQQLLHEVC